MQQNAELSFGVVEGEEVVVTAQLEGQARAINQQLSSNTIVNVVSEDWALRRYLDMAPLQTLFHQPTIYKDFSHAH